MIKNDKVFSIKSTSTLSDVEEVITRIHDNNKGVNIKIPRKHTMRFFKDSWISSLIGTASENRKLIITDWHTKIVASEINKRFSDSLIGITSAFLADEIINTQDSKISIDIDEIIEDVAYFKEGVIEDSESGKGFVFCSFDDPAERNNYERPFKLSATSKQEFIKKLLLFKSDKIDDNKHQSSQLSFLSESYEFANFIYELYENTIQHGRWDINNNKIKGVRSFSIKKHISFNQSSLIERAKQFNELKDYISNLSKLKSKNLNFYEVSISDNGIGILDRFLTTKNDSEEIKLFNKYSKIDKINKIISDSLSSKSYPGSGYGISNALENIEKLKGFVSLRTDDLWMFFDGSKETSGEMRSFNKTESIGDISKIKGTHYNILIPVT